MKQKLKGLWLDLKSLQLLHKDVYSAAKVRCKILIMTGGDRGIKDVFAMLIKYTSQTL